MSAPLRRGACPSLSAPMPTGDGLLVRLSPAAGALTPRQLGGIAAASARHGNGRLEITARGNLQIRGLGPSTVGRLAEEIAALAIAVRTGLAVETGPLAGLDAAETADPRPLAEAIRKGAARLAGRLGPKVSVTVDGGGRLPLAGVAADVALVADGPGWQARLGGTAGASRALGRFDAAGAVRAAADILAALAARGPQARARDLTEEDCARLGLAARPADHVPGARAAPPVGLFALKDGMAARGFALPFGQIGSKALAAFAQAAGAAEAVRLAPGRGLLVTGLPADQDAALVAAAGRLGLVAAAGDPRLAILACAGAPACRSAHLATRALAAELAARHPALLRSGPPVHLSGCAKGCAAPAGPAVTLTGGEDGCLLSGEAGAAPALRAALLALGRRHAVPQAAA